MRKGFIICFLGVDGSGKTTHAKFLKQYLTELGYSCVYIWGAFRPFFSYFFFGFTRLLNYWRFTKKEAYTDPLEYAPKHIAANFSKLWQFLILIDYQLKALIFIRLPLLLGKVVICDRYLYDILMELKISSLLSPKFALLLLKTMPPSTIIFLLDVPEDLASHRRNFSNTFFSNRRSILLSFAKKHRFEIIDTSMKMLENQKEIRKKVLVRLSNR